MTYGLISDIHSNIEALSVVLAELTAVDVLLCMGDIVGYGPDPAACIERLRSLPNLVCVTGNHDLAVVDQYDLDLFNPFAQEAIVWTKSELSDNHKLYLSELKPRLEVEDAVVVHGALAPDYMGYITTREEAMPTFNAMLGPLCFIGHTHITEYYRSRMGNSSCEPISLWPGGRFELEQEVRYIVNPGSVGQPRDGNRLASFGLYDSNDRTIKIRRIRYDIRSVQRKMRRAGLPPYLAERLSRGR